MSPTRRHDIDALRAIAFLLLILYHIGMFYVEWGWHVKSNYPAQWLQPFMLLVNQWRMPLIFLISGVALHFLIGQPRRYRFAQIAKLRSWRLLLPLLFGMAVIVPPQAYYEALANGVVERGYGAFLLQYFSFAQWPQDAFAGSDNGVTWNHLWYLPYLLFYTLIALPLIALSEGRWHWLRERLDQLSNFWLWLLPIAWLMPIGIWVFPKFPFIKHDLTGDWYAHAMYGSFFAFGYLLGCSQPLWQRLASLRWITLPAALATYGLFMGMNEISPAEPSQSEQAAQVFIVYLNRWTWLLAVLGWSHHLLARPQRWLNYANRAVFPWYILHQSITVAVGYELTQLALGPVVEPLLLIGLTFAGCALGMWLVERWIPWLRPCLGLKRITAKPAAAHGIVGAVS